MRWDFFVKCHSDDAVTKPFDHLTWRTTDGQFYVGSDPPAGATMLGVYYLRAATLGGMPFVQHFRATVTGSSSQMLLVMILGSKWQNPFCVLLDDS
jgi:choline dehydrogenase